MSRGLSFPYKQIDGRLRIELEHKSALRYEVLVDSGSDICVFHADIGRAIGLDIESGERFELGGVTGAKRVGYFHKITIRLGSASYQTKVGFTDGMRDDAYGWSDKKDFLTDSPSSLITPNAR